MSDYKELIYKIRGAAARWEEEHPIVGVGQMRYCDALRDAAGAIEQLCTDVARLEAENRAKEQYIAETIGKVIKERDELKEVNILLKANCDHFKRERDTAIEDLRKTASCLVCKHFGKNGIACDALEPCHYGEHAVWEWRGVQGVEHEGD